MGCFFPKNIHEAIIIHMINREEHRESVMSIGIMGFVPYLKDKSVYCFACVCVCVHICACALTCMLSASNLIVKVKAEYP